MLVYNDIAMKNIFSLLIWIVLWFGIVGCDDFLEESSQDEVRPNTVSDLEQLLLGEGYLRTDKLYSYLELLTDNVQNSYSANKSHVLILQQGLPAFTWEHDMFDKMEEKYTNGIDTWEKLYSKIKGCNVVLDMLDKVIGNEDDKLNQRGQALALRGYYYFLLVNTFAQPYNKEGIDLEKALGVPLILNSVVKDEFPKRESMANVYKCIEADLLEAADLVEKYGQNNVKYKVTPLFVYNLLSRMYLYMENWRKAAEYASIVIEKNPQLCRLSDFVKIEVDEWFGDEVITYDMENGGVLNYKSPELIWGYGDKMISEALFQLPDVFTYPGSLPVFSVSDKFLAEYEANDLRSLCYYQRYFKALFPMVFGSIYGCKSDLNNLSNPHRGMRIAEAYLTRAEANIRLFLIEGKDESRIQALEDLNYLRENRFRQPYDKVTITDGPTLLEFCLNERRKELAFDNHRWFDLRRCGMPELVHEVSVTEGEIQEYRLEKQSNRYVLPIPKKVLDKNPALVQNP